MLPGGLFEIFPQVILRRYRRRDEDRAAADRMDELDRAGMQRDAAVAVRARGSVLQIAADRASYLRQLGPYLVVSSGKQLDFEQPVTIALGQ